MRTLISIFALPEEIDELERTLVQLKFSSQFLDPQHQILIDVSLGLSDYLTDWTNSTINKDFFYSKFIHLKKYTDWCAESNFNISDDILGCVSQRRVSSKKYNVDNIIWLDTDIIFYPGTLAFVLNSAIALKNEGIENYIITPEIVRIWDSTWDSLVNEKFKTKPCGYEKINDPYADCGFHGDATLEEIDASTFNQPKLKFAGGWFTCLSTQVLKMYPVPESFGHYGLEDTFIMWADSKYNKVKQFKIRNLIICEDYKYRNKEYYLQLISKVNRKDEFLSIARNNFELELHKIWKNADKV